MTEQTKKIVLPAYLLPRLEAFRVARGDEHSYVVRDKTLGKSHDFEPWQFFILEVLPGCETLEKMQTMFLDRFDRNITPQELNEVFAAVADDGLFDESALKHPLLAPFARRTYTVEDGKAVPKTFTDQAAQARAKANEAAIASQDVPAKDKDLPAGVQDALGLDWRATKMLFGLFDPRPLLTLLMPLARPLRWLIYLLPLLLLAAGMLVFKYGNLISDDLRTIVKPNVTLFEHLLFVFLTVHFVATTTSAFVAHYYKAGVEKLGITLVFGFIPRWVLKVSGAERLTRPQTMWLHGSVLVARLMMLALGLLVWYNTRDSHATLPEIGLLFMVSCGLGLLIESGNPLVKSNAYFLLSAYLNEPHLRGKAYAALVNKWTGQVYRAADSNLLALYALLSTTYVFFVVLFAGWLISRFLLGDLALGGTGIAIIVGFAAFMLWRNYAGLKKFGETYARQLQFDRWRTRTLKAPGEDEPATEPKTTRYWPTALLVGLILLLFVPYPYEPGGSFSIYPARRQVVTTDTPGVISEVYFDGGESVKQGTVLARLQHDDYAAEVKVLTARIQEQEAIVADLRKRPKPEEVRLAEQALEVARTQERFSGEKVPRFEKLYKLGAISLEELETARKSSLVDQDQVVQKQASLELVKVPVTKEQIDAAEAKLAALVEERDAVAGKIERTVLRMPFDGNILSLHLKDRTNSFLDKGQPFASVENTGVVTAEIDIAESDLQYVQLGATVRVRPVSFIDREVEGKIMLIDRNVTTKSIGNVVKVLAEIRNEDGLLKTGMTGQAKIKALTMPVWQAFTLAVQRFVSIQVWSWIP